MYDPHRRDRYYDIKSDTKDISVIYEYIIKGKLKTKVILSGLDELDIWIKSEYNNHITLYQNSTNIASNFEFLKAGGELVFYRGNEVVAILESGDLTIMHMLDDVD